MMKTTHCDQFRQLSEILMRLGDIGREAGVTFAWHRPHMAMCQSDFSCAVLRGVVTEQQYDFFHEHRYLQVTLAMGYLMNTAKEVTQVNAMLLLLIVDVLTPHQH